MIKYVKINGICYELDSSFTVGSLPPGGQIVSGNATDFVSCDHCDNSVEEPSPTPPLSDPSFSEPAGFDNCTEACVYTIRYETYFVKDRIVVRSGDPYGTVLFDSGCVGTSSMVTSSFEANACDLPFILEVDCDCEGITGTTWWVDIVGCRVNDFISGDDDCSTVEFGNSCHPNPSIDLTVTWDAVADPTSKTYFGKTWTTAESGASKQICPDTYTCNFNNLGIYSEKWTLSESEKLFLGVNQLKPAPNDVDTIGNYINFTISQNQKANVGYYLVGDSTNIENLILNGSKDFNFTTVKGSFSYIPDSFFDKSFTTNTGVTISWTRGSGVWADCIPDGNGYLLAEKCDSPYGEVAYISVDNVPEPLVANPVLKPGAGFTSVESQPSTVGSPGSPGYNQPAIAQWDVVKERSFTGNFEIGIVAHHLYGIRNVDFRVNGGDWYTVNTFSENPRTKVRSYWAYLDANDYSDGDEVIVEAIVYPNVGDPVRMVDVDFQTNESLKLFASPSGNDISGWSIIELTAGSHNLSDVKDDAKALLGDFGTTEGWLIIRPAAGLTKDDVTIVGDSTFILGHTKFENITYEPGVTAKGIEAFTTSSEAWIWMDNCNIVGVGEGTPGGSDWSEHFYFNFDRSFVTDCTVDKIKTPFEGGGETLIRETVVPVYYADLLRNFGLVANLSATQFVSEDGGHLDMVDVSQAWTQSNCIIQDVNIDSLSGSQGVAGGVVDGLVFKNVSISGPGPDRVLDMFSDWTNTLFEDCTFTGSSAIRSSFVAVDVVFRDTEISSMNLNDAPGSPASLGDISGVTVIPDVQSTSALPVSALSWNDIPSRYRPPTTSTIAETITTDDPNIVSKLNDSGRVGWLVVQQGSAEMLGDFEFSGYVKLEVDNVKPTWTQNGIRGRSSDDRLWIEGANIESNGAETAFSGVDKLYIDDCTIRGFVDAIVDTNYSKPELLSGAVINSLFYDNSKDQFKNWNGAAANVWIKSVDIGNDTHPDILQGDPGVNLDNVWFKHVYAGSPDAPIHSMGLRAGGLDGTGGISSSTFDDVRLWLWQDNNNDGILEDWVSIDFRQAVSDVVVQNSYTPFIARQDNAQIINPLSTQEATVFPWTPPTLSVGSGFSGSTITPSQIGSVEERTVAKWNVVPQQDITGEFNIGVIAYHLDGIDRVEISANDGPWSVIPAPSYNPRTECVEYWAVLDTIGLADGPIELRAIAYPVSGKPYVLQGGLTNDEKIDEMILYSNNNDTYSFPVVELAAGIHNLNPIALPTQGWLTIRPAPGVSKDQVIIEDNDTDRWNSEGNLKIQDVTWNAPPSGRFLIANTDDTTFQRVWFDNVSVEGSMSGDVPETIALSTQWHYTAWTDSYINNCRRHFKNSGKLLIRNVTIDRAYEDIWESFGGLSVNVVVNNHDKGTNSTFHNDVIDSDNAFDGIYQDINVIRSEGQGLFTKVFYDSALVRVFINSVSSGAAMQLEGETYNVLLKDCEFNGNSRLRVDNGFSIPLGERLVFDNTRAGKSAPWLPNNYQDFGSRLIVRNPVS